MSRAYYSARLSEFIAEPPDSILGQLVHRSEFDVTLTQRRAWVEQIAVLKRELATCAGGCVIHFEFVVPRLGRRIDTVLLTEEAVFVLEFKLGERRAEASALDQAWDYALDLKNFHEPSHGLPLVPIVIPTALADDSQPEVTFASDHVARPMGVAPMRLGALIHLVTRRSERHDCRVEDWAAGRYQPTPTIVEAATALYAGHSVEEISRSGAGATNLSDTAGYVNRVIDQAKHGGRKVLCLITGVPGAGKTLVGLDLAYKHRDPASETYSVFLSGNGPLVAVLREALARDRISRESAQARKLTKKVARQAVESMIQNVHHFRDACLHDPRPPIEHVAVFDEAQRAWNQEQTSSFMKRKRGQHDFAQSEAQFLMSCLDRHSDWAVVVCLVGGGQEIHTGEAGIGAWIESLLAHFPQWELHMPGRLRASEYGAEASIQTVIQQGRAVQADQLHLGTSMRSFRAQGMSEWVRTVLDLEAPLAVAQLAEIQTRFPVMLTRNLEQARQWLRARARGSERSGLVVSSQALRLKPHAIDVRAPVDPIHWFLGPKDDVRASSFLEDAATEFQVQGLELDWSCVVWDADFRWTPRGWEHWSFVGDGWQQIRKDERKRYLKNAYRVLLTRARQGMVICVPEGHSGDHTRRADYYDGTFQYLRALGLPVL